MKKEVALLLIGFACFFMLIPQACENNNEVDLYGVQDCDTTNITWDSKIAAILQSNCVECHGPELSYNGIRHDSYAEELVVINDGRLRGVVNHLPGYVKMPQNRPKLNDCQLKIINKWIENGAPEN